VRAMGYLPRRRRFHSYTPPNTMMPKTTKGDRLAIQSIAVIEPSLPIATR
jgi:hypothetical protein